MDTRKFRKVGGFDDVTHIEIAVDSSAYRVVIPSGPASEWATHDPDREPLLTIATAEARVANGSWEEL